MIDDDLIEDITRMVELAERRGNTVVGDADDDESNIQGHRSQRRGQRRSLRDSLTSFFSSSSSISSSSIEASPTTRTKRSLRRRRSFGNLLQILVPSSRRSSTVNTGTVRPRRRLTWNNGGSNRDKSDSISESESFTLSSSTQSTPNQVYRKSPSMERNDPTLRKRKTRSLLLHSYNLS